MNEIALFILVGSIAALLGLIIGSLLQKRLGSTESHMRELTAALDAETKKSSEYQQHVASHFSETATLLNELTVKYKDIHEHLALGADQLCRDEQGHSLLAGAPIELSIQGNRAIAKEEENETAVQPPLDYAPKSESDAGTLSEDYGLEKVNLHDSQHDEIDTPFIAGQGSEGIAEAIEPEDDLRPYTSAR